MRNNNLKNIIKVINTALLVSTLTLSLTACGRTDGKSDNSNNEADTAVVAVNNSDTDSMQNVNADDLSVNSDENQNTSEADNTSDVTDNENNADIEDENNSGDESISNDNSDYDTDNYTENGNNVDDNSQQPVYNDTFSYVSGGAEDDDTQENIQEAQHKTTICIDAGHGGSNEGTKETYDGVLIKEKDINLVIAKKLQWYLEQNDNLNVIMTRTSDTDVSIGGRIDYAKGNNADYVISVHINSKSQDNTNPRGCMVLMSCSRYQPSDSRFASIYDKENMLANAIIRNLNNIGIPIADDWNTEYTNGILQRTNTVNELYPDGSPADYYGLIYNGTYAGIPTIIIEHSFLSNENDYRTHFSTDSQLDALARADAQGILEVVN